MGRKSHDGDEKINVSYALSHLRAVAGSLVAVRCGSGFDDKRRTRLLASARRAGTPAVRLLGRAIASGADAEAAWACWLLCRLDDALARRELARLLADRAVADTRKAALLASYGELTEARTRPARNEARLDGEVQGLLDSLATPAEMDDAAALVLAQVPPDELDAFCAELSLRGGARAQALVRAIASRAMRPLAGSAGDVATPLEAVLPRRVPPPEALREALRGEPDDAALHTAFGLQLLDKGELSRATFHLERAAAIAPDAAVYHWNLAVVAQRSRRQGRMYLALVAYLDRAERTRGHQARRRAARAIVVAYNAAVRHALPGVRPADLARGEDIFGRAYAALVAGDAGAAAEGFLRVLKLVPAHAPSWAHLGTAYAQLGMREEARDCLERALSLQPGTATAIRRLEEI